MSTYLLFSIRLHEGRYHGSGTWPPSPARLFQALVAAAGISGPLRKEQIAALEWLEGDCDPPLIAASTASKGQPFENFVPNNDLDAKGGDPRNIGAIRTRKPVRPKLFDGTVPFLYAWRIPDGNESVQHVEVLRELAEGLYQFGRGVDLAWATAEVVSEEEVEALLGVSANATHRPTDGGTNGLVLECPSKGSLASLQTRHAANERRLQVVQSGQTISQRFRQLPKPRFTLISYDCPPARRVFDLRDSDMAESFAPWPLRRAFQLVTSVRDQSAERLAGAFPQRQSHIDRWFIGRRPDGTNGGSPAERIRLVPLPSIGYEHADLQIRRLLVEIPADCPFAVDDVAWAFNGLRIPFDGGGTILTVAIDLSMLGHYLAESGAAVWRSVTPMALPEVARRRRIEPTRRVAEAKSATEKYAEQSRAAHAVLQALRHAGIRTPVSGILVQREPFYGKGERVEPFATDNRFAKECLWHVEVTFSEPCAGPLILGDGRFCGLGIMMPVN